VPLKERNRVLHVSIFNEYHPKLQIRKKKSKPKPEMNEVDMDYQVKLDLMLTF